MRFAILFFALVFASPCVAQSLFSNPGASPSLYQDRKPTRANEVGDILTVLITETTSATNTSNISTSKSNNASIASQQGTGRLNFIPGFGLNSNSATDFSGDGTTARQQQIQARVSVSVVGLRPNGDLMVEGSRSIEINGEREVVHLTGAVNPLIIPADNTIESYRMSDLQISYKGKGVISQGSRPGIVARFFSWIF
ncbi:MAG: flagellar basal body L-ring protein FlgH [bacterium]|nr:flagellar basal body L-ring protein FlgH [bacterium]